MRSGRKTTNVTLYFCCLFFSGKPLFLFFLLYINNSLLAIFTLLLLLSSCQVLSNCFLFCYNLKKINKKMYVT